MRGNMNMPVGLGGSQDFSLPSGRITGIRSWMWVTTSFALVVRMAKLTGFFSAVLAGRLVHDWPKHPNPAITQVICTSLVIIQL
jgi:hypothetical protein